MDTKRCTKCGETKPLSEFYAAKAGKAGRCADCKLCRNAQKAAYNRKNPTAARDSSLSRRYGLSPAKYESMLADQRGVCAICGDACVTGERLCVDHNHDTGTVRGLLCRKCNSGIGHLRDDPSILRTAASYLEQHQ